jgi:hypothetical protein
METPLRGRSPGVNEQSQPPEEAGATSSAADEVADQWRPVSEPSSHVEPPAPSASPSEPEAPTAASEPPDATVEPEPPDAALEPEPPAAPVEPPLAPFVPPPPEAPPPIGAAADAPPPPPPSAEGSAIDGAQAADRPELAIGVAFAGGFLLALILRRLAR